MSTSLLVTKMEAAAKAKGIECHIEALAEAGIAHKKLNEVDVLLLGPQVRFLLSKFKKEAPANLPIEVIDTVAYGTMNGAKVLDRALELIG